MKTLKIVEFGNPILRKTARKVPVAHIKTSEFQNLINDIRDHLVGKKLGVGLAAPQIGESMTLSVIAIRPTEHRPKVKEFDLVIINPSYKGVGEKKEIWEGCLSAGKSGLFAKVPRYKKIEASYLDEKGKKQTKKFSGLKAQVIQHETDHLNGILFVDNVTDSKTFMTLGEYRKRIKPSK